MKGAYKATLLPNYRNMGGIKNTIIAAATSLGMAVGVANAKNTNQDTEKTQTKDQIICTTSEACHKLSASIQTQITELKKSDNPDYDKLDELQEQLIALENNRQEEQQKTIAAKNNEQEQLRSAQDKKLAELEGALLSKK